MTKIIDNQLVLGGVFALKLAKTYGTPLFVMDEEEIERVCLAYTSALKTHYGDGTVCFASKAFSTRAMLEVTSSFGLGADVISIAEMNTALSANAKPIYFHGVNKLEEEIEYAVRHKIHCIVIDSADEVDIIDRVCKEQNTSIGVMLRLNPAVCAHTHSAVQTANEDSKFGLSIASNAALECIKDIVSRKNLRFLGLHFHIGSQIFEVSPFSDAVKKTLDLASRLNSELGIEIEELNIGGGLGVSYTPQDESEISIESYIEQISCVIKAEIGARRLKMPRLILEPGRSIAARAGTTLYTVGAIKESAINTYAGIDGGMCDNPRYALYGSRYSCAVVDRAAMPAKKNYVISGKCCESGDIITDCAPLPILKRGDILAVFSTGAYNYSMASNYNKNPIPAVVFVGRGKSRLAVRRQTNEEINQREL